MSNADNPWLYEGLVARNAGYVEGSTQQRMRECRLLVAGCGIGSSLAVAAVRMGFEHLTLVDGDVVDRHNLNRQFYDTRDVGRPKVAALHDHLKAINPGAQVEAVQAYLDESNTETMVSQADVVFDTVDFLDLPAILRLHDCATRLAKPVFTALSAGFGALVWFFPAGRPEVSLPVLLAPDLAAVQSRSGPAGPSYAEVFEAVIGRLAPSLDNEVVAQIGAVLKLMKDGKPCPASQLAVGSFTVAGLALSMMHDLLAGLPIPESPRLVVHSLRHHRAAVVELGASSGQ